MTLAEPTVLIVDDSREIREIVSRLLTREGYDVEGVADADAALESARRRPPDVVVLDVGLPGTDGIEVCRSLRAFSDSYIVMLTARDSETDKVIGLTVGADDYLTKPFSGAELSARVRAMLRRPRMRPVAPVSALTWFGPLSIDAGSREVTADGVPVALTRKEFDLLAALASAPNIVLTRQQLLDAAWGPSWFGDEHVVDVHMSNMRRKLQTALGGQSPVRTVRGVGYRLAPAA